jgi:hypothetical protein
MADTMNENTLANKSSDAFKYAGGNSKYGSGKTRVELDTYLAAKGFAKISDVLYRNGAGKEFSYTGYGVVRAPEFEHIKETVEALKADE